MKLLTSLIFTSHTGDSLHTFSEIAYIRGNVFKPTHITGSLTLPINVFDASNRYKLGEVRNSTYSIRVENKNLVVRSYRAVHYATISKGRMHINTIRIT